MKILGKHFSVFNHEPIIKQEIFHFLCTNLVILTHNILPIYRGEPSGNSPATTARRHNMFIAEKSPGGCRKDNYIN